MNRAHKIRLYPTMEQQVQLAKTAGAARYAYNWALLEWGKMYRLHMEDESLPRPSAPLLSRRWTRERPAWAPETYRGSQTRAILSVGVAFRNFFSGRTRYPKFHKKADKQRFYVDNAHAKVADNHIQLPHIGYVRLAEEPRFSGKILSYTITGYAGKWYLSIAYELQDDTRSCLNPTSTVGIDVGVSHIATTSDGTFLNTPESLKKLEQKLRAQQRALARSQRNSNNYKKKLLRKQRIQQRIDNVRQDVTHKFTSTITKNHGVVVVEDLDLNGMRNKAPAHLRRSLASSMMGMILWQLSYKANQLVKAPRFYPSSKTCSACGHVKEQLALSERIYVCEHCGAVIDRDINAAINLSKSGWVTPKVPVECACA